MSEENEIAMEHLEHAVAEQVVRAVLAENPDLPIVAEFYRGQVQPRDEDSTPAATAWYVLVKPAQLYVAVSAVKPTPLGWDLIGRAVSVDYPRDGDRVDLEALAGSRFHVELLAAIRYKTAVVEAERGAA